MRKIVRILGATAIVLTLLLWGGAVVVADAPASLGDVNGDGMVNALDITKVERIIVELDAPTAGADVNQDGTINVLDITKIERFIAELD
jgi:hypothetical protein